MILKAKHHFLIYPFFKLYTIWKIKRVFNDVEIIGDFLDNEKPVLVIANHISWWDGFWIMYLNLKLLNRKFHFLMLEDQLRKHWFFNYTGGYSINKQSKSIIESLRYTEEILQDRYNMVMIFPQGEITSMHQKNIYFERGAERIINNLGETISVLMTANIIDYFSKPKPSLNIYIQELRENQTDIKSIEKSYQDFYNESVTKQFRRSSE